MHFVLKRLDKIVLDFELVRVQSVVLDAGDNAEQVALRKDVVAPHFFRQSLAGLQAVVNFQKTGHKLAGELSGVLEANLLACNDTDRGWVIICKRDHEFELDATVIGLM